MDIWQYQNQGEVIIGFIFIHKLGKQRHKQKLSKRDFEPP